MSRDGALLAFLGRTSKRFGSPSVGVIGMAVAWVALATYVLVER